MKNRYNKNLVSPVDTPCSLVQNQLLSEEFKLDKDMLEDSNYDNGYTNKIKLKKRESKNNENTPVSLPKEDGD